MASTVASMSTLPTELLFPILEKMDGTALLKMYQTNSGMSEAVENCLRTMDPRKKTLGKGLVIHLTKKEIIVYKYMLPGSQKSKELRKSKVRLPIDVLESNIWRFLSFKEIHLENSETAAKFLDQMKFGKPGIYFLKSANCDISHVAKAMQYFQPINTRIISFSGDLKKILPALPIKEWTAHTRGFVTFPKGIDLSEEFKYSGEAECVSVLEPPRIFEGRYKLKFPCGTAFLFILEDGSISYFTTNLAYLNL